MASAEAPRYREVADALRRQIAAGELGSHDRLASERQIADRFRRSRMTARQAVELLVRRSSTARRGRGRTSRLRGWCGDRAQFDLTLRA